MSDSYYRPAAPAVKSTSANPEPREVVVGRCSLYHSCCTSLTGLTRTVPAFLVSQAVLVVKNLPANAGDTRDLSSIPGLGRPLEKEMATHFSILAWKIP